MATAIICEFNPFHNGHAYLLSEAKRLTGEPNMVIMSGSFTQRGEAAVCDKFTRAGAALRHGADLVVELPTAFAVANAERFAQGGVRIAKFFSGVHTLAFGCETDDLDALRAAAAAIRSERVNALIAAEMRGGGYYPRALEEALRTVCGEEVAAAVSSPNNILAVEYIRALEGTEIRPLPIMRQGAAHDSDKTSGGFASASYIRSLLREGKECAELLPEIPRQVTRPGLLDRAVLYRLRTMTAEELRALPEVGEGLENRILEAAGRAQSAEELLTMVKTKRYTHARLRRILACAFLGLTEELQTTPAGYARILGFTDEGEQILRSCTCKIITSAAKALRENDENTLHLSLDVRACDIAALAYDEIMPSNSDYCTRILRENREKRRLCDIEAEKSK